MAATAPSDDDFLQVCRRYSLPCPVCGVLNSYLRLKPDIVRPRRTEGDGHPIGFQWSRPGFDHVDPKRFFWGICSRCRFAGELDSAEFRQSDKLGENFRRDFRPEALQAMNDAATSGRGVAQSLGQLLRPEANLLAAVAGFHLGVFSHGLRSRPLPGSLARYYLRIAWLYRDQPLLYPDDSVAAVAARLAPLERRWQKDLPEYGEYPVQPQLALNEVVALRLSRAFFERNYETLREARLEDELRLRQLLAEIAFRIYQLTSGEDDYRKASSYFSGLMQQCVHIIADKSIAGGVVNRARGLLEPTGDRARELRELREARATAPPAAGGAAKAPAPVSPSRPRAAATKEAVSCPDAPAATVASASSAVVPTETDDPAAWRQRALDAEEDRARWRQLATRDGLTGLPNRTALLRLGLPKWLREVTQGGAISCVGVWFAHLGAANQQTGWNGGDQFLKEGARALRQALQEGEELYRLDGASFALVGAGRADAAQQRARELARQLQAASVTLEEAVLSLQAGLAVVTVDAIRDGAADKAPGAVHRALQGLLGRVQAGNGTVEIHPTTRF